MNFSEWLEDREEPLYEVKGEMPKCPPGYKWNPKTMECQPKAKKDNVSGKGEAPYMNHAYNIIGSSGYDGGWAFEEQPTSNGGGE